MQPSDLYLTCLPDPPLPAPAFLLAVLTSKHLSSVLSLASLPHLYASIFRATFDFGAIVRRFPSDRYTARHLGDELVRRWECLKRIREGNTGFTLEKDLWTVWMMCLENGKHMAPSSRNWMLSQWVQV